ncbi:calcium-translocating P-type ATPase, PMCA-type [uncultured Methanobrevibacter sp.]|uniref:calcium-translocating P-type ATPase, PMCA-type n=1 Tax=uncultured Methanobrevibacter sp. TaxID=253161 RepID=UPI0025EFD819|nr:calcium-translocating P-type ATPase, PMCA-type [uncultured Methanobrevibacter sp.]
MSDILSKFQTSAEGLSESEVQKRQSKYGLNELEEKKPKSLIKLFLEQFIDVLNGLLFVASIAAYAVGDIIDSAVILLAILLNAILGFIQEYRSQKAVEMLKSFTTQESIVRRNSKIQKIESKYLTIGDIVILEEGDKVPADLILIESNDLKVDESFLTGESEPASKDIDDEVHMDSNIISGNAEGVVTKIGMETAIGEIAGMVQEESEDTPLQNKVSKLGKVLSFISIIVCVFVFILELSKGIPIVETFMTAVSLAVAAVPEGLPAVLTLTLALGMQQMAKSNAIVKRLLSVETLGSCTVICSDKTGTLTENKMTVRESYFFNENKTSLIGVLCNNAVINNDEIIGDPTDGAILKYFNNASDDYGSYKRVNEIPLDSNRKMMSCEYTCSEENNIILSKGAPEIILNKSKYIDDNGNIKIITPEIKEMVLKKTGEMANDALRVIGFAYKRKDSLDDEENLIFTGLVGIIDPPKKEAEKAVKECQNAGIKVVMITGDYEITAKAIASELNILTTGKVITGSELEKLSDEEYMEIVEDIEVYARVKPTQKMRIVETLKRKGHIVSMTGDGVNDAPALKKASIGVAMGNGTEVAQEAADMIIEDNNFATIVKAVEEGRKIYDNIKRFVKFQVSTNIGAILTIIGTSLLNLPIPFTPVQLLWINIVMDGPPAQTLGMEGAEKNIMKRKPETGDILNKKVLTRILISGLVMAIGTTGVFLYQTQISTQTKAMTVAFTLFVIYQLFNALNCKSDSEESSKYLYLGIVLSLLLQILIIYIPQLQIIFKTTAIGITDWIMIVITASTIIIVEKIMNRMIK